MAPHVRAKHHCSQPVMASELLGLYLVSVQGERTAICNIHSYGAAADDSPWHNVLYTGPGQKSGSAIKHHRSKGEVAAFEKHHEVGLENDVAMGGPAAIMHSRKRKSYDVWLFGPLSFLDRAYGSLIVELTGYDSRTVMMKREENGDVKWWAEFPKGPVGFSACKILNTGLHLPAGSASVPGVEELRDGRRFAPSASIKPFVRAEWKVESRIAAQTDCALYEQEGI
jgi:hypothetical protein